MEDPLGRHRLVRLALEPRPQQAQPLHRAHRVHRRLELQVYVVVLDQDECLVHDQEPLGVGQRPGPGQELLQGYRARYRGTAGAHLHGEVEGQGVVGDPLRPCLTR